MKVLLTGAAGQLGQHLQSHKPTEIDLIAITRDDLDLSDKNAVLDCVSDIAPDLVINTAAYTAVDMAETHVDSAYATNRDAVAYLAQSLSDSPARLIHVSTDFVFDGNQSTLYAPTDTPAPCGIYGSSKRAGELQAQMILGQRSTIVRTSWLFSAVGRNFLTTMLELMRSRDKLQVVCDQIGTPTSCHFLSEVIWLLAGRSDLQPIYHAACAGVASWYDLAVYIGRRGVYYGLLDNLIPITPIASNEYTTAAPRPAFSALDTAALRRELALRPVHWMCAVDRVLESMVSDA